MSVSFHLKKQLDRFALDVEYQFPQGVLVVQGESGSGKSTLLNCISGLLQPDDGYVQIGQRLLYSKQEQVNVPVQQRNIGYVFQKLCAVSQYDCRKKYFVRRKTIAPAMESSGQEMLDYVTYIMDTFRIQHLRKKYPRQISGGEKQRTALARAIVTKPDLLLLDEPFSALDIKTKEIVYQEFLELKHAVQIPIILISHDPREGDLFADHRLYLADGHLSTAI